MRSTATHPAPDWQADLLVGTTAEKHHQMLLGVKPVITAEYEIKLDRYYTERGTLFIELEQSPRGEGYRPSGAAIYPDHRLLAFHPADRRGQVYGPAVLTISARDLRAAVHHLLATGEATVVMGGGRGTNPTRGVCLTPQQIIRALAELREADTAREGETK